MTNFQGRVLETHQIINRIHNASTVDSLFEMQFIVLITVNFSGLYSVDTPITDTFSCSVWWPKIYNQVPTQD